MPSVGFEPTIPAGERPQTYVLENPATGIGTPVSVVYFISVTTVHYIYHGAMALIWPRLPRY